MTEPRSSGSPGSQRSIVILTGAGISAESGVSTFRDPDGIWAKYDVEEVATPQGFAKNPKLVHDFYNGRRAGLASVTPNAAHLALARLEREFPGDVLLVTQNVDNLHERAGSRQLIHMHGELMQAWCRACDRRHAWATDMDTGTPCPSCQSHGHMRPDVVWFGEMPYAMDVIDAAVRDADVFLSIGTSGNVHPAAGLVAVARRAGARAVELNLEPSEGASLFDEAFHGRASVIVPIFVEALLSGRA
jgi:NAD-dependent deacetylase